MLYEPMQWSILFFISKAVSPFLIKYFLQDLLLLKMIVDVCYQVLHQKLLYLNFAFHDLNYANI